MNSISLNPSKHQYKTEFQLKSKFNHLQKTNRIFWLIVTVLLSFCMPLSASATSFDECSHNFYASTEPDYINDNLLTDAVALCFNGFATLYSGVTRTPMWSAEHLTRDRLYAADELPREDSFHAERRLPNRMQAALSDYSGSGYDRGHLAPNADMANKQQQYDSFSLANIVPQAPKNNRYIWKRLESVTRYLTKKYGEVYVLTGVVFQGDTVVQLNNRVIVPTHLFKAVYIPELAQASAYYTPNDDSQRIEVISIDELALRSGIDAFPAIPSEAKSNTIDLPKNFAEISEQESKDINASEQEESLWVKIIIHLLRWLVDNILSK